jgi:hypothetical protein
MTPRRPFSPSRQFRRAYDKAFKRDPGAANVLLLLAELADEKGQVSLGPCPEADIQKLMAARFDDPRAYQLPGGPRR